MRITTITIQLQQQSYNDDDNDNKNNNPLTTMMVITIKMTKQQKERFYNFLRTTITFRTMILTQRQLQ